MIPDLSPRKTLPSAAPGIDAASEQYLSCMEATNTIIFRFTPHEIETLDFTRFLVLFGIERADLSGIEKLRGNVCVALPDSSPGQWEPFLCETSRRFCRAFYMRFPYWAYFFSLQTMALWKLTLALVENSAVFQFNDQPWRTKIILQTNELEFFISEQMAYATNLASRVGLVNADELEGSIRKYYSDLMTTYSSR